MITLRYQSCPYIIAKPNKLGSFFSYLFLYLSSNRNTIKVYIGYLPITIHDEQIRVAFQPYCQVANVIIKKGNAQGTFDKFCYGFVTLTCDQKRALQVISMVEKTNPNWKMKIKDENFQQRPYPRPHTYNQFQPNPNPYHSHPPPLPPPMPSQLPHPMMSHHNPPMRQPYQYGQNQQYQNDKGEIRGEKLNKIIVRELWLGGIPQLTDHNSMKEVMSRFGQVEATEIFPKFAFVKYKRAADASTAYERAHNIYQMFGENSGFRISFSDPSRRKDIVGNHYQFERNSVMLPILFLGFPPITSANIDLGHMLNICEKFGIILNHYMKKSTNSQMRSYFLFTYENLKTAMKAKQELSRRKDLLGEKRVQITLLLDEKSILQGHDFSFTEKNFVSDQGGFDRMKKNNYRNYQSQPLNYGGGNYQQSSMMNPPPPMGHHQAPPPQSMNPSYSNNSYNYQNRNYPPPPPPSTSNQPPYYYPDVPGQQSPNLNLEKAENKEGEKKESQDFMNLIQSVLDEPGDKEVPKKDEDEEFQNPNDIISKILGVTDPKNKEEGEYGRHDDQNREPNWAGFLTWRGVRRAGVDGYTVVGQCEITDYNINITSVMDLEDVLLKDKAHMMILEPSNQISRPVFDDYLKAFRKRTGVSVTKNWLIYLLGKNSLSDKVHSIKDNELLMIMEKSSLVHQIKEKIFPCDDVYFE